MSKMRTQRKFDLENRTLTFTLLIPYFLLDFKKHFVFLFCHMDYSA
jgi:hypothetical protein